MKNMEDVGAMIKDLVGSVVTGSFYHFHMADENPDENPQGTVCLTYITYIYTMFNKNGPLFLSFIIHSNSDQFTRNFQQL